MKREVLRVDIQLAESQLHFGEELEIIATHDFGAEAVNTYSLEEADIDNIIGTESYCGGNLPLDLVEKLDEYATNEGKLSVFFSNTLEGDNTDARGFMSLLQQNNIEFSAIKQDTTIDWNQRWKDSYEKIEIGEELIITPSWEKNTLDNKSHLYIYPGMGFGTGTHETTYLCLQIFLELYKSGFHLSNAIDYGCGSGILGIAVKKFYSSSRVIFYDIDEQAITNTVQNLQLNDIPISEQELSTSWHSSYEKLQSNLVFANILQNVLLEEKLAISSSVAKNGHLILSGLLKGQEDFVRNQYQSLGLSCVETYYKSDWVAMLFVRL